MVEVNNNSDDDPTLETIIDFCYTMRRFEYEKFVKKILEYCVLRRFVFAETEMVPLYR